MSHYVYAVECRVEADSPQDTNPVKIGYTKNIRSRIAEMQVGNPYMLVPVALGVFETEEEARKEEKRLHKRFKNHNIRGEWFTPSIKTTSEWKIILHKSYIAQSNNTAPDLAKMFMRGLIPQTNKQKKRWARKKK